MSNTAVDNYIDSLEIGSEVEVEIGYWKIIEKDPYECTILDDEGDTYSYTWGEIAEFWEIKQAEEKADNESNRGIDNEKNL